MVRNRYGGDEKKEKNRNQFNSSSDANGSMMTGTCRYGGKGMWALVSETGIGFAGATHGSPK
jgi:hypothetical protein